MVMIRVSQGAEYPERELTEVLKTPYVAHLAGKEIWRSSQMNKSGKQIKRKLESEINVSELEEKEKTFL